MDISEFNPGKQNWGPQFCPERTPLIPPLSIHGQRGTLFVNKVKLLLSTFSFEEYGLSFFHSSLITILHSSHGM